jgi:hypothetical protein
MNDPKREYCSCGYSFIPSTFMKMIMLIKGEYKVTCPRCQTVMVLGLSHFVYVKRRKNETDKGIWKNG